MAQRDPRPSECRGLEFFPKPGGKINSLWGIFYARVRLAPVSGRSSPLQCFGQRPSSRPKGAKFGLYVSHRQLTPSARYIWCRRPNPLDSGLGACSVGASFSWPPSFAPGLHITQRKGHQVRVSPLRLSFRRTPARTGRTPKLRQVQDSASLVSPGCVSARNSSQPA